MSIGDLIQTADWKKEKHAPVIDCPDEVEAGEFFMVKVGVGKEIAHPNTAEHHRPERIHLFGPGHGVHPLRYVLGHHHGHRHAQGTAARRG